MKVILVVVFIVILGGASTFFFLGGDKEPEIETEEEVAEVFKKEPPKESPPSEGPKRDMASVREQPKPIAKVPTKTPIPKEKEPAEEEIAAEIPKEFVLDPAVYPTLNGFLEVEGDMIKSLSISYRQGGGPIVGISDTKVINSIFMVDGKIWNLHGGGKSYSVRIGHGAHNNLTVIFTRKDLVSSGANMEALEPEAPQADNRPPPEESYEEAPPPPEAEVADDEVQEEPPMDPEEMMKMKLEQKLEEMGMGSEEE